MASVLLTAAGAALGAAIPGVGWLAGPLLGMAGGMVGGGIDSALGLTPKITGARLASLKVQDSREGASIPRVYGTMRVAGNVIWASNLIETRKTTKVGGGKGGSARATSYQYNVHLAVGLCAGPSAALLRVWADSKLIYDAGLLPGYAGALRFYSGSNTQSADALLQSYLSASNTPAFRGTSYIVVENLQLEHFGNRIPNLTFEVEGISGGFAPACLASITHTAGEANNVESPRRVFVTGPNTLLITGFKYEASHYRFIAEHYTFASGTLTRTARATSAPITIHGGHSFALSPDGRYVACLNSNNSPDAVVVLYNTETQTFGTPVSPVCDYYDYFGSSTVAWLDNVNLVVTGYKDSVNPALFLIKRAGNAIAASGTLPAVALFDDGVISTFWDKINPTWMLGALTFFMHDGAQGKLALARVAVQNGSLIVARLPAVTIPPDFYRLVVLPNDTLLLANENATCTLRTYAVTTSGLTLTRSATTLALDTTVLHDIAAMPGDRLAFLSNDMYYSFAEVQLTASSFTLAGADTPCAGSPTAVGTFMSLQRFGGSIFAALNDQQLIIIAPRRGDNILPSIITDLCAAIGMPAPDIANAGDDRVPGFITTDNASARTALESLQEAYAFTLIESDAQLKVTAYTSSSAVPVPQAARRASSDEKLPPSVAYSRAQAQELPTAVQVDYLDSTIDYNSASRIAARHAPPHRMHVQLGLPLALDAASAQRIAEMRLARALAEQSRISISVARTFAQLDAGDVITVEDSDWRIVSLSERGGVIDIEAVRHVIASLSAPPSLRLASLIAPNSMQPAELLVLDLPALTDAEDQPGLYFAASASAGWRGGVVYRSADGESAAEYLRLGAIAVTGVATDALLPGTTELFDNANTITVATNGELQSITELAVLNGGNVALLGDEIIQFKTATLVATNTYRLSGLLRARRGTEDGMHIHAAGDRFVLLDSNALVFVPATMTARGQTIMLQLVTAGQLLAEALPFSVTYGFRTLAPYAPVHLKAKLNTVTTDIMLSWQRRARVHAEWVDYTDVALDESAESYSVSITDGFGTVLRTFTPSTTTQNYTAAHQLIDFGGTPYDLTFTVQQVSPRYGPGSTATATIII